MPVAQRIQSLKAIGEIAADGGEVSFATRDFLDGFYERPDALALAETPLPLAGKIPDGARLDAYLAAIGEHLCRMNGWPAPAWTFAPERFLELPWFCMNTHAGRMLLLMDSPSAFRARNIFVSADALTRA